MKYLYVLLSVVFLSACKKDEVYGPYKLKNGQEVELLVSHRYAAINDPLMILPQNEPVALSIHGFEQRKPGYVYRVKAKFNVEANPPQDASDRWFNLTEVISEEKYQGNETFDIALIKSYIPGGPFISMRKIEGKYVYIQDKLELTYANETVKNQLEEISSFLEEAYKNWEKSKEMTEPKWKSIKATVTHDPDKFGTAYLVQHMEFSM
jgi:hypothetical protein